MCESIDNAKSYDLICKEWKSFRDSTIINKCIINFTKLLIPGGNVLDIGCGTGYPIAKYLCDQNFFVTGVDISSEMIKEARKLHLKNATFINKDFLDFSSDKLFDGIIAFDSIWHIARNKQVEVFYKISSLIKKGGYFIFTHGNCNGETIGIMFDQKFYYSALDITEIKILFSKLGFKFIEFKEKYKEKSTGERDLLVIAQKI